MIKDTGQAVFPFASKPRKELDMTTTTKSPTSSTSSGLSRAIARVKRACREMDYAQRRLLEIRTGVAFGTARSATTDEVHVLDSLWSLEAGSSESSAHAR